MEPTPQSEIPRPDRRIKRSYSAAEAMPLALNGSVERGHLNALFIADDKGYLVCSSTSKLDLSGLAALAPIVARRQVRANVRHKGGQCGLTVRSVQVLGETLHMAAVGGGEAERRRELACARKATQRILA